MLPINKTISMIERFNLMYRNQQFKKFGLHGYQASFLLEIVHNPKISQDQLTQNMHIDKSNVARGCQALEDNGYIKMVKRKEDRRYVELIPTEEGLELSKTIRRLLKKQRKYLMQDFDSASEEQFLSYLEWLKKRAIELLEESNS